METQSDIVLKCIYNRNQAIRHISYTYFSRNYFTGLRGRPPRRWQHNFLPQRRIDQMCQGGKMVDVLQCRNYQGQADCLFLHRVSFLHASTQNTWTSTTITTMMRIKGWLAEKKEMQVKVAPQTGTASPWSRRMAWLNKAELRDPRGQDFWSIWINTSSILPFWQNWWTSCSCCKYVLHQIFSVNNTELTFHLPRFLCHNSNTNHNYISLRNKK